MKQKLVEISKIIIGDLSAQSPTKGQAIDLIEYAVKCASKALLRYCDIDGPTKEDEKAARMTLRQHFAIDEIQY